MGLLIKLQNGDTQLKSLKFGKDRPGGGDSGQPFIKNPIPINSENPQIFNDFVLRGGIEAPLSAAEDTARLAKYFFDFKSPSGLLFTAKQNLLSKIGTKTEASKGLGYAGGALNEGIYTPASTLIQAGLGFLGSHVTKQGLDPTGLFSLGNILTYQEAIQQNQFRGTEFTPENNRLLALTDAITNNKGIGNFSFIKGYNLNTQNSLISYQGGSDSDVGVGNTNIDFATDNFGVSIKTLTNKPTDEDNSWGKKPYFPSDVSKWINPINLSVQYSNFDEGDDALKTVLESLYVTTSSWADNTVSYNLSSKNKITIFGDRMLPFGVTTDYNKLFPQSIPTTSSTEYPEYITDDGIDSYQYNLPDPYKTQITQFDNRDQLIIDEYTSSISTVLISKGYKPSQIETLEGVSGKDHIQVINRTSSILPSDSINNIKKSKTYTEIYNSRTRAGIKAYNKGQYGIDTTSLIPFKITVVNPKFPQTGSAINFKAYIDTLSDSYNADWSPQVYMGRGEKFYKYNTFSRDISLGFTVVAENKNELFRMYEKLNELAASLAPTYTSAGYMAGNLHRLTIGNYVVGQYGIMTSLTYDVMEESPWEITPGDQVPHYIKVSGIKFTPIHNWRPESFFNTPHDYIYQSVKTNAS